MDSLLLIGEHWSKISLPAALVDLETIENNCQTVLKFVESLSIDFRAHVKTHKCAQALKIQLSGQYNSNNFKTALLIVSTWQELQMCLELSAETGMKFDIAFGLPAPKSLIPFLVKTTKHCNLKLLVDHPDQIEVLDQYIQENPEDLYSNISIFVKIDCGTHRSGIDVQSSENKIHDVLQALKNHPQNIDLHGFYCHSGHSYAIERDSRDGESYLHEEIGAGYNAVKYLRKNFPELEKNSLTVSFGATPTLHVAKKCKFLDEYLNQNINLELHAGNYVFHDMQQLKTGLVDWQDISLTIAGEVISAYPNRNSADPGELATNLGSLSMSREPNIIPSQGVVVYPPVGRGWILTRLSQEHGILTPATGLKPPCSNQAIEDFYKEVLKPSEKPTMLEYGTKVRLLMQHSCITAANFNQYFVIDKNGKIIDVWPTKRY